MTWYYLGQEFTPDQIGEYRAFVYIIYNLATKRAYVGKKRFLSVRSRRTKKRKYRIYKLASSDWENYYGSCAELLVDLAKGHDCTRQILRLCKSNAEASYYELKEQLARDVLLKPKEYYNSYVGARIHRNHVLRREK